VRGSAGTDGQWPMSRHAPGLTETPGGNTLRLVRVVQRSGRPRHHREAPEGGRDVRRWLWVLRECGRVRRSRGQVRRLIDRRAAGSEDFAQGRVQGHGCSGGTAMGARSISAGSQPEASPVSTSVRETLTAAPTPTPRPCIRPVCGSTTRVGHLRDQVETHSSNGFCRAAPSSRQQARRRRVLV
jgi:hypothetical protein